MLRSKHSHTPVDWAVRLELSSDRYLVVLPSETNGDWLCLVPQGTTTDHMDMHTTAGPAGQHPVLAGLGAHQPFQPGSLHFALTWAVTSIGEPPQGLLPTC